MKEFVNLIVTKANRKHCVSMDFAGAILLKTPLSFPTYGIICSIVYIEQIMLTFWNVSVPLIGVFPFKWLVCYLVVMKLRLETQI